ncbi:alpha-ketoglutarate-dependent dioxygenase AlkB [Alcanivorax sp. 24]|uniref:alpha-ketoglutarate-dependent dioxygenase AlkB family protein n=1 Tax=Alcanivorax sp. 24 TaxID=2545266 RepID=UPI001F0EF0FE|nr:alpha-ketoglutarate-dependent dioxygenase AlkB [Alcanivorax sp. 24]
MTVNHTLSRLDSLPSPLELGQGARIWLIERLLGPSATALFNTLCNELPWEQPRVQVFGRSHPVPRLVCWLGDAGVTYRYSGLTHRAGGWPDPLMALRCAVTSLTGLTPNGALANLYRDGDDTMGWHRDNEPELGSAPWIISYNLGATRDFCLRRHGEHRQSHRLPLSHDSLLIMSPQVQRFYEHALPRRRRVREPRVNLTFRHIVTGTMGVPGQKPGAFNRKTGSSSESP